MNYITREDAISMLTKMGENEAIINNSVLGDIADCIYAEGLGHDIWGKDKREGLKVFPD